MPCVHQSDYQIKINMRFGLAEQQCEIKTNKHPNTWRQNKQDSRDRANTLLRDLIDKAMK